MAFALLPTPAGQLIVSCGHSPTRNELIHLEQLFWTAAVPTATPADGAIETLTWLRDAGIRTGIVSYADIPVFEALLKLTGLAGLTDVEICSEVARSCKPHPEIFHRALRVIGVDPPDAMFIGDDTDTDIVGGNSGIYEGRSTFADGILRPWKRSIASRSRRRLPVSSCPASCRPLT